MQTLRVEYRHVWFLTSVVVAAGLFGAFQFSNPSVLRAAEGDEYELVLEKVGSARQQADKALREALSLDDDGVKEVLGGLPAVLKTGITKSEADMLKAQILNAVGKGRIREQVFLRVRVVKASDPNAKPKPAAGGSKTPKATGKPAPGKGPASVKRGDPPAPAQAAAELEKQKYKLARTGDEVTKVEPASFFDATTDDHLWLASGLPDLKEIQIYDGSKITDTGLSHLSRLKNLNSLMVLTSMPSVTDEGLKHLAGLTSLGLLSIESPQITDKGLENLDFKSKPNVWSLSLNGTKVTDKGLAKLNGLRRLQVIQLNGCAITDEGLKELNADSVQALHIGGTKVTVGGLDHLQTFSRLGTLTLGGPTVTDEWLKKIPESISYLELVDSKVTNAGLQNLKSLPDLSSVSLKKNKGITKAGVEQAKQTLPKIRFDFE